MRRKVNQNERGIEKSYIKTNLKYNLKKFGARCTCLACRDLPCGFKTGKHYIVKPCLTKQTNKNQSLKRDSLLWKARAG